MPSLNVRKRSRPPTPLPAAPPAPLPSPPGSIPESPDCAAASPFGGDGGSGLESPPSAATAAAACSTEALAVLGAGGRPSSSAATAGGRPPLRAPSPAGSCDGFGDDDDDDDENDDENEPSQRGSRRERVKTRIRRKLHRSGETFKPGRWRHGGGGGRPATPSAEAGVGSGVDGAAAETSLAALGAAPQGGCRRRRASTGDSSKSCRWGHHNFRSSSPSPRAAVVVDEAAAPSAAAAEAVPKLSPPAADGVPAAYPVPPADGAPAAAAAAALSGGSSKSGRWGRRNFRSSSPSPRAAVVVEEAAAPSAAAAEAVPRELPPPAADDVPAANPAPPADGAPAAAAAALVGGSSKSGRWGRRNFRSSSPHAVIADEAAAPSAAAAEAVPRELPPPAADNVPLRKCDGTEEGSMAAAADSSGEVSGSELGLDRDCTSLWGILRRTGSCLDYIDRRDIESDEDDGGGSGGDDGDDADGNDRLLRAVLSDDCDDWISLRRRRSSQRVVVTEEVPVGGGTPPPPPRRHRLSRSEADAGRLLAEEDPPETAGGGASAAAIEAEGGQSRRRRRRRRRSSLTLISAQSSSRLSSSSKLSVLQRRRQRHRRRYRPQSRGAAGKDGDPVADVGRSSAEAEGRCDDSEDASSKSSSKCSSEQPSEVVAPLPSFASAAAAKAASSRSSLTSSASSMTVSTGGSGGSARSALPGAALQSGGRKVSVGKEKERRVKPYSAYGKTYLTEDELVREMLRPSAKFEDPTTGGALSAGGRKRRWRPRRLSSSASAAESFPGEPQIGFGGGGEGTATGDGLGQGKGEGDCAGGRGPDDPDSSSDDGRIGTLSVEVLSCIGLPKFDRFSRPDVRAYLLLGDSAFATDTIPSCRSPMWPRLSRRAASFPVHHVYARLYAGVFGVNSRGDQKENAKNDDFAGRVAVDVSALRPGTEYDATMPLRSSTFVYDRRPRGAIRLRVRLEWRSEREAVLSYLRAPTGAACPPGGPGRGGAGNLAIPCADARTFRNVALTVHGEHLPGKYDRRAFRATMREAALYQVQLRHVAKVLANDAVTYERPMVSLYVFAAWMHCVYRSSAALVPSYAVGYLLFLFMNNYVAFHLDPGRHGGYRSVDITEIVRALLRGKQRRGGGGGKGGGGDGPEPAMRPLSLERRAPVLPADGGLDDVHHGAHVGDARGHIHATADHAEFPFSQRHAYPKSSIRDAIVPRSNKSNSSVDKLSSRLGMYADSVQNNLGSQFSSERDWGTNNASEGDENDEDSIRMDDSDLDGAFDTDEDEGDDDDDEAADSLVRGTHRSLFVFSSDPSGRSIPVGPQQDVDFVPKRVPFKQNLAKFENRFHNWTFRLFDDRVATSGAPPCHHQPRPRGDPQPQGGSGGGNGCGKRKKDAKKKGPDEFDRRLGLSSGKQNPLLALTAGYLGPVMNMVRIWLSVVRVSFNVAAWTDPFLSFWVLCSLLLLAILLAVFPWRGFMLVSGIVLVGPQNMILKKIARKVNDNATQAEESARPAESSSAVVAPERADRKDPADGAADPNAGKKAGRRSKFRISRKEKRRAALPERRASTAASEEEPPAADANADASPPAAFSAQSGKLAQRKRNLPPRSVLVPYSRLRKERFYDWPPDPSVSRAAPVSGPASSTGRPEDDGPVPKEALGGRTVAVQREGDCGATFGPRKRLNTR